ASIYLVWRIVNSRFGMVIQGARSNDTRMRAIGFPTYRYKLTCFVIAGTLCGLAGALLANHTDFVSPAMMYWTRSGDLIIMVVLGGMGSIFGPLFGAVALLILEEALSGITEYWQIILGPLLLLVVLFGRGGIDGLLGKVRHGCSAAGRKPVQALRGHRRNRQPCDEHLRRGIACRDRTQRRGLDNADCPAQRPACARFRSNPFCRQRYHSGTHVRAQRAWAGPLVPDHLVIS